MIEKPAAIDPPKVSGTATVEVKMNKRETKARNKAVKVTE